jgi:hypothetical protein
MISKKELKEAYKTMKFRVGIFQIRNKTNNCIFLKTSTDLDRAFNSDAFQLNAGMHSNPSLQEDWKKTGAENFVFEIVDELKTKEGDDAVVIKKDLQDLLEMHLTELKQKQNPLY